MFSKTVLALLVLFAQSSLAVQIDCFRTNDGYAAVIMIETESGLQKTHVVLAPTEDVISLEGNVAINSETGLIMAAITGVENSWSLAIDPKKKASSEDGTIRGFAGELTSSFYESGKQALVCLDKNS